MKLSDNYKDYLKGEFYKCLCLFEEDNEGLSIFISTLLYEVYGLQYKNVNPSILDTLSNILEHFYDDSLGAEYDIETIRRECFHCMKLINRLIQDVGDGDGL